MELFFSVIIPAYNTEAYVGEAIESALAQKDVRFEIVVVNDGSTDKTPDIINSFGEKVRIVTQENMGLSAARNSGAKASVGNVLAFLDADDIWLPDKLRAQGKKLKDEYRMVYTNRYNIGDIGDLPEIQTDIVRMPEGDIWQDLLLGNMITASSVVIFKDAFEVLGGFRNDLRSCEDWELWLRYAEAHRIGYCPEPLIKYRNHSGGLSKNYIYMSKMREEVILTALKSERGRKLSSIVQHKILARTWATSAWNAACGKDRMHAFRYYLKALLIWPFEGAIWYDLARAIAGRY